MEVRIRAIYDEHKGRYGYRRITAALCSSMPEPVNHKCVQRLMQKMGLRALIRAKKRSRHVPGMSDVHVPNAFWLHIGTTLLLVLESLHAALLARLRRQTKLRLKGLSPVRYRLRSTA
jgi:hypothetical protein